MGKKCSNCGEENISISKYCRICGAKLDDNINSESTKDFQSVYSEDRLINLSLKNDNKTIYNKKSDISNQIAKSKTITNEKHNRVRHLEDSNCKRINIFIVICIIAIIEICILAVLSKG